MAQNFGCKVICAHALSWCPLDEYCLKKIPKLQLLTDMNRTKYVIFGTSCLGVVAISLYP